MCTRSIRTLCAVLDQSLYSKEYRPRLRLPFLKGGHGPSMSFVLESSSFNGHAPTVQGVSADGAR